jgi:hypothetical protein
MQSQSLNSVKTSENVYELKRICSFGQKKRKMKNLMLLLNKFALSKMCERKKEHQVYHAKVIVTHHKVSSQW